MERKYLSINQAAEELGVNPFTIRRWIKSGKLAAIRMGAKLWRISPEALAQFLEAGKTALESQEQAQKSALAIQRAGTMQAALQELAAMAQDRLLTSLEVAKLTAMQPGSVRKARQRGQLNGVLQDRNWLYKPEDVIAWLKNRK